MRRNRKHKHVPAGCGAGVEVVRLTQPRFFLIVFPLYFPSDRFLNDLESRRIWVEGGHPSGVDNLSMPP